MPGAIAITVKTRLLVCEGNYLLLDRPRWAEVRPLLDETWYVDAPRFLLRERLLERARAAGRTEEEAVWHVDENDLRNAELVEATKSAADLQFPLVPDGSAVPSVPSSRRRSGG